MLRQARPGAAAAGIATIDDRRDFVQSTIRFLESASNYYAQVTAAPPVERVLRQWQQMVEAQGRMVINDLNADRALYQGLRAAYRQALTTLIETAARLTNRPAAALYEQHRSLIPEWAFPTQRVAGITADLPTEAQVDVHGRATFTIGQVSVIVLPDRASNAGRAETTIQFSPYRITFRALAGRVTSFTGPGQPETTIQTVYGRGLRPEVPSAYGRGTTPEDVAAGTTTLGFHEASHARDYLRFLREQPYPHFTGAIGMSTRDFNTAMADYQREVGQYAADLTAASLHGTDCVGTTIDQHNAQRGVRGPHAVHPLTGSVRATTCHRPHPRCSSRVMNNSRPSGDRRRPRNRRHDRPGGPVVPAVAHRERRAGDRLLHPRRALRRALRRPPAPRPWRSCRCRTVSGRTSRSGTARSCASSPPGTSAVRTARRGRRRRSRRRGRRAARRRRCRSSSGRGRSRSTAGVGDEEEHVAAVGDVARDAAERRDVDLHVALDAPAGDVVERHEAVVGEHDRHDADRRLDEVLAGTDATEPVQRLDQPDHPVPAHPEHEGAVEEDHAGHAALVDGRGQQGADHRLVAPRLVDDRRRQTAVPPGRRRRCAPASVAPVQCGEAVEHDTGGFSAGVRVDDRDRQRARRAGSSCSFTRTSSARSGRWRCRAARRRRAGRRCGRCPGRA